MLRHSAKRSPRVTIYTCNFDSVTIQECDRLRNLLQACGIDYVEYRCPEDFLQNEFENEFGPDAVYPQISLDRFHLGKLKDLLHWLNENEKMQTQRK